MPSNRIIELKRTLDRLVGGPNGDEPSPEEQVVFDEAIDNFRSNGPELLDEATEFLWAYYRSVRSEYAPEQRRKYGIAEIADSADIWNEVEITASPSMSLGGRPFEPGRSYISFEGEVSWEPEHGLQLVFEHGLRVCKVGPYDGHHTNASAYADHGLLRVVFK